MAEDEREHEHHDLKENSNSSRLLLLPWTLPRICRRYLQLVHATDVPGGLGSFLFFIFSFPFCLPFLYVLYSAENCIFPGWFFFDCFPRICPQCLSQHPFVSARLPLSVVNSHAGRCHAYITKELNCTYLLEVWSNYNKPLRFGQTKINPWGLSKLYLPLVSVSGT